MKEIIRSLLAEEGITEYGFLPAGDAKIINPRLMPDGIKSVLVMLAPYDTGEVYRDGVSAYAHIRDYHRFFGELFVRLLPRLQAAFSGCRFFGFADRSPINEKDAAAKAGLGIIGRQSLLLNPTYGSYVFLGSVLTDLEIPCQAQEIRYCENCGLCAKFCPGGAVSEAGILPERCLSSLSQKKKLTDAEKSLLRDVHIAWGCDRCQTVCPHNLHRAPTSIPFFLENRHGDFRAQELSEMDEETFAGYAFSWRGRNRITENLQNLDSMEENSNNFT